MRCPRCPKCGGLVMGTLERGEDGEPDFLLIICVLCGLRIDRKMAENRARSEEKMAKKRG